MVSKNTQRVLTIYFLLASLEASAGLLIYSKPEGDLSSYHLLLNVLFFGVFIGSAVFAWRVWRVPSVADRILQMVSSSPTRLSRIIGVLSAISIVFSSILLTPLYRFGSWAGYVERLVPVIGWGALMSLQTLIFLLFWRRSKAVKPQINIPKVTLLLSGAFFLVFILLLIWIAQTKIGVISRIHRSWYSIGVPLLPGQVWIMGWLTVAFGAVWAIWKRYKANHSDRQGKWKADILVGLGIWAITAVIWSSISLPRSFFFPGPYPPNNVIYPYADSAIWDTGGLYALIGQGFDNGDAFQDHVGWMAVLAFLHLLVGDDYILISSVLAALLAVFPALMYWLGKSIHSRWTGFFIAGLTIFHQLNSFSASNMIDLSHARFLLTEYPTRVGLAILALLLFFWFRAPRQNIAYALPVGGLLATMILVRFTMLAFPLAVLVGAFFIFGRDWKGWLRSSFFVIVSVFLVLAPWMWRSWTLSGTPFFFAEKTQNLFKEEYRFIPSVDPTPSSSLDVYLKMANSGNPLVRDENPVNANVRFSPALPIIVDAQNVRNFIVGHFFHNLVASALILPTSLSFDDVQHTIYEAHPYWEKRGAVWQGNLTLAELILLVVNLALISIGLGVSWRKWKLPGLIPLGICIAYGLSLAVARTSGGRYIVPMDWGFLFYWGIGTIQVVLWVVACFGGGIQEQVPSLSAGKRFSFKQGWLSLLPFLLFVGSMTVMDRAIPEQHPELNKTEIYDLLKQSGVLEQMNIPERRLAAFLEKKNSRAYWGQAIYPRYYGMGQGEYMGGTDAYEPEEYPRLAFTLIGAFDQKSIVFPWMIQNLPRERDLSFSNTSDVIVVGCVRAPRTRQTRNVIDALIVVILGENPLLYVRNPDAPLKCPVSPPVCSDNFSCQ